MKKENFYEVIVYFFGGWHYDSYTFYYYHFYIDDEVPTVKYNVEKPYQIVPNAEKVYNSIEEGYEYYES
mgnify:CR=1 FL=1